MIIRRDTSNRRERIVALLREQGSVQIPALAEGDFTSRTTQTLLRKDLNFLDDKGICTRSSGGRDPRKARLAPVAHAEEAIDVKRTLFADEKIRIVAGRSGKAGSKMMNRCCSIRGPRPCKSHGISTRRPHWWWLPTTLAS